MLGDYCATPHDPMNQLLTSFSQLAEQYGDDVASEVLARSRSNLHLDLASADPYAPGTHMSMSSFGTK
jgi:hypothetical protein